MTNIKPQYAAGKFYTAVKDDLLETLENFKNNHKRDYNYSSRAIIAPHAGYNYSGQLAFDAFYYLDKSVKNIFIFAPTHTKSVNNLALSTFDEFETPLGNLKINKSIQQDIIKNFNCEYCDNAFEKEHAVEVLLPFVQYFYEDVKIVPILVGNDDVDKTLNIIKYYYNNKDNAFVISTDLSHFLKEEDGFNIDMLTARMIEDKKWQGFRFEQACGAVPLCAVTQFAVKNEYSLIRIGMSNSARTTGDTSKVVGYGAWFLYENEKNDFIEKYFAPKLFDVAKKTIDAKLSGKSEINITNYMPYPPVFDSDGACFVTLELIGNLRGCIGSVLPHSPLIVDLIKNSYNAAFSDPRFKPLTRDEFDNINIIISLLSPPKPIAFKDEEDLLEQMQQNIDGIIIRDNDKQALYLPSVWKQLPDKKQFLNSLKQKAGFDENYFSETFQAFRFTTNSISDK